MCEKGKTGNVHAKAFHSLATSCIWVESELYHVLKGQFGSDPNPCNHTKVEQTKYYACKQVTQLLNFILNHIKAEKKKKKLCTS